MQNTPSTRLDGWQTIQPYLAPVFFLGLSLWICLGARQVPFGSIRMPGAGFFPLLLGMSLGLLSLILLATILVGNAATANREATPHREILALIGTMFASAWLFERAGFLLTMGLFVGVTVQVLARTPWALTLVIALIGSIASYLLFDRVLMISLPAGVLSF